jgi:hypothetical protein
VAGEWIKLAPKIEMRREFLELCKAVNLTEEVCLFKLYRLAGWFHAHANYGQMSLSSASLIDKFIGIDGFAEELHEVGWLRFHKTTITLFGFCEASAVRKSLGIKIRRQVLSAGKCAACGETENLVVDHIVPIVRGGSSDISNLQALCAPCNRSKGRKLPTEWRKHG